MMKPSSMAWRMLYSWKGEAPDGPGSSNSALVLNFGVAVKAKKLRFGCRARFSASRSTAALASSERSSSSSSESCAAIAASIPSLFSMPLSAVAVSPLWEECASSTMTAKRLPAVSIWHARALLLQRRERPGDEGELLDGGDDDRRALGQGTGELLGVLVDLLDHAGLVLELVDGRLQLLIEHAPVGDDDDRVKDLLVLGVVQAGQPVREPGNGVRLAGAGRVLDQIVPARAMDLARGRPACAPRRAGDSAERSWSPCARCARPWSS